MKIVRIIIRTQVLYRIVLPSTYERRTFLVYVEHKMRILSCLSFIPAWYNSRNMRAQRRFQRKIYRQRNTCRAYILKTIRLIWRFRFVLSPLFFLWRFSKTEITFQRIARENSSALWITSKWNWGLSLTNSQMIPGHSGLSSEFAVKRINS